MEDFGKISEEDRASHVASTDYRKNSDLYSLLVMAIERIAAGIAVENRSIHVRLLIPNHNLYLCCQIIDGIFRG